MVIDERLRHALYRKLEEVLGPEEAAVLMNHLPPVGWADVATKADLAVLERRFDEVDRRFEAIDRRFEAIHGQLQAVAGRMDGIRSEMVSQTRTLVLAMSTMVLSVGGLAFAAARLA